MARTKMVKRMAVERDATNLPADIIFRVLTKVPVKPLMRFKCVCKMWCDLISEPSFIKAHLSEAIKADRKRVFYSVQKSDKFSAFDCETWSSHKEQILFPLKKYRKATFICSCNGLVLLGFDFCHAQQYVLWNPSIRRYKRFSYPGTVDEYSTYLGLSYDASTDDYKFVLVSRKAEQPYENYFVVFRFKSNSWTEKREFPYEIRPYQLVVCVNGEPHWVAVRVEKGRICVRSVYFDSAREEFKEMRLPEEGKEVYTLVNLKGRLGCGYFKEKPVVYEVWQMREYGKTESWSKLFTISADIGFPLYPQLLGLTESGGFIMMWHGNILIYDIVKKNVRIIKVISDATWLTSLTSCLDTLVIPAGNKLVRRLAAPLPP